MHAQLTAQTFHDDEVEGVWLPYWGRQLGLLVIMPKREPLARYVAKLPDDALGSWLLRLQPEQIVLELPRANITSKRSLFEPLQRLGMRVSTEFTHRPWLPLFEEEPFTRPVPKEAKIKEVLQRTTFELQEAGTEASAATAILGEVVPTSAGYVPPKLRVVRINRPFLVAVVGPETAAPLFVGQIVNP